jgi:hypothetical protein
MKVTTRVMKKRKDRKSDGVRLQVEGGKPFPRIRKGNRRVFGQSKMTLRDFGPEYEEWVRQEVARQVAEQAANPAPAQLELTEK